MKRGRKILFFVCCVLIMISSVISTTFAHSGRTDGSGGHKDNKNKSGLGGYHYHCGGYPAHLHDDGYCPYTDIMPTSVSVSAGKTSLGIGEKTAISAAVSPSNACDTYVSWQSSDTNVVKISGGEIEAVGYGTATITASSVNGKTGSVTITVKEIVAESIEIQNASETMYIGDSCKLSAVISPQNVDNPAITWSSSDESIATVDSLGEVHGLLSGSVVITATASNGVSSSKTIIIQEVIAEKVEIIAESTMIHGDSQTLKTKIYPENTSNQEIEWTVNDQSIAVIDKNGKIQAHKVGKVTVTAKQKDVSTSLEIEVVPRNVEQIIIENPHEGDIYPGDVIKLSAYVEPENATYPTVYWKSSEPDILSIDEEGNLEAKAVGKAVITAYTEDGCEETYEIEVSMSPASVAAILGGAATVGVGGVIIKKRKSRNRYN